MVEILRHRQPKGSATDRLHLNHRATSLLYCHNSKRHKVVSDEVFDTGRNAFLLLGIHCTAAGGLGGHEVSGVRLAVRIAAERARSQPSETFEFVGVGPENPSTTVWSQLPCVNPAFASPVLQCGLRNAESLGEIADKPFIRANELAVGAFVGTEFLAAVIMQERANVLRAKMIQSHG